MLSNNLYINIIYQKGQSANYIISVDQSLNRTNFASIHNANKNTEAHGLCANQNDTKDGATFEWTDGSFIKIENNLWILHRIITANKFTASSEIELFYGTNMINSALLMMTRQTTFTMTGIMFTSSLTDFNLNRDNACWHEASYNDPNETYGNCKLFHSALDAIFIPYDFS